MQKYTYVGETAKESVHLYDFQKII